MTYTWAFGEGDTGSGAVVAHTYPAVGVYTAVVTAGNQISALTATTTVTITNTPPALTGLPDQVFDHIRRPPKTIDLWDYTSDDGPVSALTYTLEITPPTGAGVMFTNTHYVQVNPSTSWCGGTDVTVRATDPGGLWDEDTVRVAVSWSCPGPVEMPGAPVLIAPVDGRASYDDAPVFDWYEVEGAAEYQIQVDDDAGFSSPEWDETLASTEFVPSAGLSAGTYTWRVRAVNGAEVGDWSEGRVFSTPGAPPAGFKLYLPVVVLDGR